AIVPGGLHARSGTIGTAPCWCRAAAGGAGGTGGAGATYRRTGPGRRGGARPPSGGEPGAAVGRGRRVRGSVATAPGRFGSRRCARLAVPAARARGARGPGGCVRRE